MAHVLAVLSNWVELATTGSSWLLVRVLELLMDLAAVLFVVDRVAGVRCMREWVGLWATHGCFHLLLARHSRRLYHTRLAHVVSPIHHLIEDLLLAWLSIRLVLLADDAIS